MSRTAATHDGSDHSYRMVIKDRYTQIVNLKRRIKLCAYAQLAFVLVRSIWQLIPELSRTGKYHLDTLHLAILASTIILLLLYLIASGFGKPHKESLLALKLYSVGSAVLGAEVFVTFWIYHVTMGPHSRIPNAAAAYPPIPTALARTITLSYSFFTPNYSSTLVTIFQVFEAAMDVCGIMCLFATVLLTKWFVEEKRDQKKQTAVETKKKTN